jgi:hypothetical protein
MDEGNQKTALNFQVEYHCLLEADSRKVINGYPTISAVLTTHSIA